MPGPLLNRQEIRRTYNVSKLPRSSSGLWYSRGFSKKKKKLVIQPYSEEIDKKLHNLGDAKNFVGEKTDPYRHTNDFMRKDLTEWSDSVKRRATIGKGKNPKKTKFVGKPWSMYRKPVSVSKSKRATSHTRRLPRRRK